MMEHELMALFAAVLLASPFILIVVCQFLGARRDGGDQ